MGAYDAEVTDRPIPHGPVLLREAAGGPELLCKLAKRILGRLLQGLGGWR